MSAGRLDADRETITIRGSDFTQISTVEVLFDGVLMGSVPTGSIGEFEIQLPGAVPAQAGERDVADRPSATRSSQVVKTTRVTNLAMRVSPRRAATRAGACASAAAGSPRHAPVFAHYLLRRQGAADRPASRAPRRAPCGTFSVKRRLIPFDSARTGRWIVQVDQKREYAPEPDPVWVRRPIDVVESSGRVRP